MSRTPSHNLSEGDWATVATIVDQFEQARNDSDVVDLRSYLPGEEEAHYTEAATELVRVDLEYHWNKGELRRLADYRQLMPLLFEDPNSLNEVAFEEYRLRRQSGETVLPEEYGEAYGVDTEAWPVVDVPVNGSNSQLQAAEPASDVAYPAPGEEFAGFRIVREIGRGTFARVFLAEQNDLARRPVVLKISRRRSLEPEHLARLQHTNIVPIHSVHETNGFIAVCMPYYGERTLASVVKQGVGKSSLADIASALASTIAGADDQTIVANTPTIEDDAKPSSGATKTDGANHTASAAVDVAISLVQEIASGLSHAHVRGIVHRDLKPANILLSDDGRPMLLDFNLSEDAAVNGWASLTVGGTLPYMAPEHLLAVQKGGDVGPQADVYSLGIILYELLTATRPFADRTGSFDEIVVRCTQDRFAAIPSVRSLNPRLPPSINSLVHKCLAPLTEERYDSADHLAEDLSRHANDLPLKYASNPSISERAAKWRRRHPKLMSAGTAGAIGLVLAAVFAGLWTARNHKLARLAAAQQYSEFREQLPQARLALSLPDSDRSLLFDGLDAVDQTAGIYLSHGDHWRDAPRYTRLPAADRQLLNVQLAELCYLQARAERIVAASETDEQAAKLRLQRALQHNRCAAVALGGNTLAIDSQRQELKTLLGDSEEELISFPLTSPTVLDDYLAAQQLLAERKYREASERLTRLRDKHPTDPVVWLLLGNAFGGLGQHSDADGALTTAIALEPRSYVARFNRGLCRLQQQKPLEAVADFDLVLATNPKLVCGLLNRALAYEAAQEYELALADLDAVITTGESPPRALLLRARIKNRLGDQEGAESDRQASIALEPWDEIGWIARGMAQLSDQPEAALEDFRASLRLNSKSVSALENIVHVTADRLNRPEEAMAALDSWLDIDPDNASALIGRAVLQARLGRREGSLKDIQSALGKSREPVILFQAACAYSLMSTEVNGDAARGLALLSNAFDRDPRLIQRASSDPDLAALREREQFTQLMEAYRSLGKVKQDLNGRIAGKREITGTDE